MELMLIVVSLVSLAIATAMSVVAWKLARDSRERSAARVDALEQLALGDLSDLGGETAGLTPALAAGPSVAPARQILTMPKAPVPVQARFSALDDADGSAMNAPSWDTAATTDDDSLFTPHEHGAPRGRWLALVGVAGMMALGAGTMYVFHTPGALSLSGIAAASTDRPIINRPLELVSLRYAADEPGFFTVSGLVHNPVGAPSLRGVLAVVYLFDDQGQYVGNGRIAIDAPTLDPGIDATFMVRVPVTGAVSRYRVGFRFPDGAVVAHIDKRPDPAAGRPGAPKPDQQAMEGS
jgi:hypothetical protein